VALYRPGPMESIPQYIERKHNASLVSFMDPRLETILDRSYGVITYQDDVMMTAITLAGYSWLEADMLRKAMGKKIPAVMEAEKERLLKGFVEYGNLTSQKAEQLWKLIEPFAAYGFNKAHAASYGRVAYQTAYMKANYPVEYMSAVLTADSGDTEKISEIINECVRMNLEVLPPDINESFADFSVVPNTQKIRFGLTTIKNFGEGIADAIIEERKQNGPFVSLPEFLTRVHNRSLNRKSLEALIQTGAFDRFHDRALMYGNIDRLLSFNKESAAAHESSQDSLFGGAGGQSEDLSLDESPEISTTQKLAWEKELLGVYVSGHPLDAYTEELKKRSSIADIKADGRGGIPIVTAGMVESVRELLTKKGDRMAFIVLASHTDQIEMTAFPETYRALAGVLKPSNCIAIKGRLQIRSGEPTIMLENAKLLTSSTKESTVALEEIS